MNIQITSREYHNSAESEVAGTGYEGTSSGYSNGTIFLCLILLIFGCVACAKYVPPENFVIAWKIAKIICTELVKLLTKSVDYLVKSDTFAKARETIRDTANSIFYPTPNYEQHEVLNLSGSTSVEMEANESGIVLLKQVLQEHNIPNIDKEEYVRVLRDNWLTTIDQLRQLNADDWQRFGIPKAIQNAIKARLDPTDEDGLSTISSNISNDLAYPLTSGRNSSEKGIKGMKLNKSPRGYKSDTTSFSDF